MHPPNIEGQSNPEKRSDVSAKHSRNQISQGAPQGVMSQTHNTRGSQGGQSDFQNYSVESGSFQTAKQQKLQMMTTQGSMQVPQTDKLKKNTRKLNSGVPAKILIGRTGTNNIILGGQVMSNQQQVNPNLRKSHEGGTERTHGNSQA